MYLSRSVLVVLAFVLLLGAVAPDADAGRNCNCTMCQPGNLLAMCNWPGHGTVYCFDYWEFQCNGPAFAAEEPAAETLVCLDTDAEGEVLPEFTDSDDGTEHQDAVEQEAELANSQDVAPVAVG